MSQPRYSEPNFALRQAEALEAAVRVDEAAGIYRDLVEQFPSHPDLPNSTALVEKRLGPLAEAEALLRRALRAAVWPADLHNNLGKFQRALDKLEEAQKNLRRAIALSTLTEAHSIWNPHAPICTRNSPVSPTNRGGRMPMQVLP